VLGASNQNLLTAPSIGSGNELVNGPFHTIAGGGRVGFLGIKLTNQGTIDANLAGATMELFTTPGSTNTGMLRASGGGTLQIQLSSLNNLGGYIRALDSSTVELNGATINGGTFSTSGSGVIRIINNGAATLEDITLDTGSLMQIPNGVIAHFAGTITNNGVIELNAAGGNTAARILDDVTLTGNGIWKMSNSTGGLAGSTSGCCVLTNDTFHTIQGAGFVGGNMTELTNWGLIDANQTLAMNISAGGGGAAQPGTVNQSTGILRASGPGGILFSSKLNNQGTVEVLNGSILDSSGTSTTVNNVAGVLIGGRWRAINSGSPNGATIVLRGSNITQLAAGTEVELSGAGSVIKVVSTPLESSLTTNAGTLRILNGRTFAMANALNNSGTVELGGTGLLDGTLNSPGNITNSGVLAGHGSIGTNVTNSSGVVSPGAIPSGVGQLTVHGTYTQGASGKYGVEIASLSNFDQLTVDNAASLAGMLNVSLIGGFTPSAGQSFTIVDASSLSGTFANVGNGQRIDTLGAEGSFLVSYNGGAGTVILSDFVPVDLPGDFNFDDEVDAADYVVYRKFGLAREAYNTWKSNFGSSAMSVSGSAAARSAGNSIAPLSPAVPEPASMLMILLAASWVWLARSNGLPRQPHDQFRM
jgi:hypothetical protein